VGDQDPAIHGVRKDRSWNGPERLVELRAGVATLINAALEREGVQTAVTHKSLRTRGLTRAPAVWALYKDKPAVEAERHALHRYDHPYEAAENVALWRAQKAREGIQDVSREAIVDHVRDRFWQHDRSPQRDHERRASVARRIAREHARTGRPLQGPRPVLPRQRLHVQRSHLAQHAARLAQQAQDLAEGEAHGAPLRVRLWEDEEQARERGRAQGLGR
jgi:hypothetical protein